MGCQMHKVHKVKVHRYITKDREYLYIIYSKDELKYYCYNSPMRLTSFKSINFNYYRGIPKVEQEEEVEEVSAEDLSDSFIDDMEEGGFDAEGDTADSGSDGGSSDGDSGGGDGDGD